MLDLTIEGQIMDIILEIIEEIQETEVDVSNFLTAVGNFYQGGSQHTRNCKSCNCNSVLFMLVQKIGIRGKKRICKIFPMSDKMMCSKI